MGQSTARLVDAGERVAILVILFAALLGAYRWRR